MVRGDRITRGIAARTEPSDGEYEKHLRVEPTVAMKIIRTKIIENLTKNYPKVAT